MRVPTKVSVSNQRPALIQTEARAPAVAQGAEFFDSAKKLVNELQGYAKEQETFDLNKIYVDETGSLAKDFEERKNTSTDAYGFALQTGIDYEKRHKDLIETLRATNRFSSDSLRDLDTSLAKVRNGYVIPSLEWEKSSVTSSNDIKLDSLQTSFTQQAMANPDHVNDIIAGARGAVEDAPGFNSIQRGERTQKMEKEIGFAAGSGYAMLHPIDTIKALTGEDPYGTAPAASAATPLTVEGLRPHVISQESSGSYIAVNKETGALGRYQVMPETGKVLAKRLGLEWRPDAMRHDTPEDKAYQDKIGDAAIQDAIDHGNGDPRTVFSYYYSGSADPKKWGPKTRKYADEMLARSSDPYSAFPIVNNPDRSQWDKRADGSTKGTGFLGLRQRPDGSVSSELSIGVTIDGKETEVPTMVPGLTSNEFKWLMTTGPADQEKAFQSGKNPLANSIIEKATTHAKARLAAGLNPFKQDSEPDFGTSQVSTDGKTGTPALDLLDASARMQVLTIARQEFNRGQVQARTDVEVRHQNALAAAMNGVEPQNVPTIEEYNKAYGPVVGPQKLAELQDTQRAGSFVSHFKAQPNEVIVANLEALRPKDSSSPTYAVQDKAYQAAQTAANQIFEARKQDPAGYVISQYPGVKEAWAGAKDSNGRRQAYIAMQAAYDKLGTPEIERAPMTKEQAADMRDQIKVMSPEQKLETIKNWRTEMGPLFAAGMKQLSETGMPTETYLANMMLADPSTSGMAANVLRGMQVIEQNKALAPAENLANQAFLQTINQQTQLRMAPDVMDGVRKSAIALYVLDGNDPKIISRSKFQEYVRAALGGVPGNTHTGWFSENKSGVALQTILPPGISDNQFSQWKEGLTGNDLIRLGGEIPRYANREYAPATEIVNNGTFVKVGRNHYEVRISPTGGTLTKANGDPYIMIITPSQIRRRHF